MKKIFVFSLMFVLAIIGTMLVSCSSYDDEDSSTKEHDASLYGEWVANDGKKYVHDYYSFYSDGTGIHGSYESDIDWVNEEDDIKWYTVDKNIFILTVENTNTHVMVLRYTLETKHITRNNNIFNARSCARHKLSANKKMVQRYFIVLRLLLCCLCFILAQVMMMTARKETYQTA